MNNKKLNYIYFFPLKKKKIFSEMNQGLIMSRGGGQLLAKIASKTDDPQTLRMVAGALANLCGNGKSKMIFQFFCRISSSGQVISFSKSHKLIYKHTINTESL